MPHFLGMNTRSIRKVLRVLTIVIFCISLHVMRGYMSLITNHPFPVQQSATLLLRALFALGSYLLSIFASCTHLMYGYIHVFIYCLAHSTKGPR